MKTKATGEEAIAHFQESCRYYNKLFIPDSPRQESVAKALADFYDKDTLFQAIVVYIKNRNGPILVFDFAIESKTYTDKVTFDLKSENKFKEILEETRKRMQE